MRSFLQFGKKYYIFRTVTSESPEIEFNTFIHETGHFLSPFFVTGEGIIIPLRGRHHILPLGRQFTLRSPHTLAQRGRGENTLEETEWAPTDLHIHTHTYTLRTDVHHRGSVYWLHIRGKAQSEGCELRPRDTQQKRRGEHTHTLARTLTHTHIHTHTPTYIHLSDSLSHTFEELVNA